MISGVEDLSIRALADRHGCIGGRCGRRWGRRSPPERKTPVRSAPKLDPVKPLIDAMLRVDLDAPRKQRHTARRVLARLVDEHDAERPVVLDGAGLRRRATPGDLGRGRPGGRGGVRAADP